MQDVDQDPSEKGLAFSGLATMEPMEPTLWSFPYGAYGGPHGVYGWAFVRGIILVTSRWPRFDRQ